MRISNIRFTGSSTFGAGFAFALAACLLLAIFAGPAQAEKYTQAAVTYTSLNTMKGSKGYKVDLWVTPGSKYVTITARKGKGSVNYVAKKAKASISKISADFGQFGSISLKFKKSSVKKVKAPKGCSGKPGTVTKGLYKGKIKFTGTNGFTKVSLKKLKGAITKLPKRTCKLPKTKPYPNNGKMTSLSISAAGGNGEWNFSASKTAKQSKAEYGFYVNIDVGGVAASESFYVAAPKATFTSNSDATTATIKPPAPFSGTATATFDPEEFKTTISGDLTVKSLLLGTVSLTAPGVEGFLSEYTP